MPKITLNRFIVLLFILTSVLPIVVLGLLHVSFLHRVLNTDRSFLQLIEHEEFILFCIYLFISCCAVILGVLCFKNLVSKPIEKLMLRMDELSENVSPTLIENKTFFSEIRRFIDKFNQMLGSLHQAQELRKDFISSLSHDIKIPLLAEQKAFELLRDYKLEQEDVQKITQSLIYNNSSLLHLINSLLDVFKFEAAELIIHKERISAEFLISQTEISLYPLLKEKNIEIEEDIAEGLFLNIDLAAFKRVIYNILMNAIENSPNDSKINIKIYNNKTGSHLVIKDQGNGIEPELKKSIFDKYSSYSKAKAGLGLGLYISKLIVEKHNGTIVIDSRIKQGTSFHIQIPIEE